MKVGHFYNLAEHSTCILLLVGEEGDVSLLGQLCVQQETPCQIILCVTYLLKNVQLEKKDL